MDEETTWHWRWKCGRCDDFVIQGEGDRVAMAAAEDVIRDHRLIDEALDRGLAKAS